MNVVFWFLARFAVAAAIICLLSGHTEAAGTFGFAWVFFSCVSWLLTPLPEPKRPGAPAAVSAELVDDYWQASAALNRAAREHRS
jgi:hypothetical protein